MSIKKSISNSVSLVFEKYFFKIFSGKNNKTSISINIFLYFNNEFIPLFLKKKNFLYWYLIPGQSGIRTIKKESKLYKIITFISNLTNIDNGAILSFEIHINKFLYLIEYTKKENISFLIYSNNELNKVKINNLLPKIEWLNFKAYDRKKYLLESSFAIFKINIISESKEYKIINIIFQIEKNKFLNHLYYKKVNEIDKMIILFDKLKKIIFNKNELKEIINLYNNVYNDLKNIKIANFNLNKESLEKINQLNTCHKRLEIYYDNHLKRIIIKIAVRYKKRFIYLNNSIKNKSFNINKNILRDYCEEEKFFLTTYKLLDSFDNVKKEGYIYSKEKYLKLKATIKRWKSFDNYEILMDNSRLLNNNKMNFLINSLDYKNNLLELKFKIPTLTNNDVSNALKAYLNNDDYFETEDKRLIKLQQINFKIFEKNLEKMNLNIYSIILKGQNKVNLNFYNSYYLLDFLKNKESEHFYNHLKKIIKNAELRSKNLKINLELKKKLHPYQFEGVRWFKKNILLNMGGILADEMGLGKTIQVIALFNNLYSYEKIIIPSVVICPSSLIYNWKNEFDKFSKELNVVIIDGNKKNRVKIIESNKNKNVIFITSYHQFARDTLEFENLNFYCAIVDEGQMIKNYLTKFTREIKKIKAMYRFALSGTPIENNLLELWSIFDFILPGYLLSKNSYKKNFYKPFIEGDTLPLLKKINPFILRRLKKNVLKNLSTKDIKIIKISQNNDEQKYYLKELSKIKYSLELLKSNKLLKKGNKHLIVLNAIIHLRIIASSIF